MGSSLAILAFLIIGYTVGSVRIINQGDEALVERLGRYHRKLEPGLNFIVPLLDRIVCVETTRERMLDFEPQEAITKDNVSLNVDAVVYWRILELQHTYYTIDDIEDALQALVITSLRSEIGRMKLEDTYSSRREINRILLQQLDEATATWGVKVTRVEVQNIILPRTLVASLERERAAESEKKAAIAEAEGKKQAAIEEASGTVEAIQQIKHALGDKADTRTILQYLLTKRYVEANYELGQSDNSKIVFMDPKAMTQAMAELIGPDLQTPPHRHNVRPGNMPGDGGSDVG
ncbi:MAG TPA: SPFH domain-containing protein [Elainellaceae cyanobacterium]|jgi:regulator of protease activity HflC (stomatin/prohibitin superfamily)